MAVTWNGDAVLQKVNQAVMRGVVRGTQLVHERGNQKIKSPPKTGRIYARRGIKHRASAPGEAPATDTGRLVQSGSTLFDHTNLIGTARWSTVYARPLELGTAYAMNLGKKAMSSFNPAQFEFGTQTIAPRPFARPALHESRDEIEAFIGAEVGAALG